MELCSTIHSRRQRKQLRDTGLRRRRAWANLCVADHRRNDCKRMTKGRRVKADRRQGAAWPALCKTCPTACSRLRTSIQRHHILAVELLGIKCEICTKKHLQKGGESDACCRRVWLASCGQASEKPQHYRTNQNGVSTPFVHNSSNCSRKISSSSATAKRSMSGQSMSERHSSPCRCSKPTLLRAICPSGNTSTVRSTASATYQPHRRAREAPPLVLVLRAIARSNSCRRPCRSWLQTSRSADAMK